MKSIACPSASFWLPPDAGRAAGRSDQRLVSRCGQRPGAVEVPYQGWTAIVGLVQAFMVIPEEAVRIFSPLSGSPEGDLVDNPNVGLDGLMEMEEAWLEVNGIKNFMQTVRELLEEYCMNEIGEVIQAWNALHDPRGTADENGNQLCT